MEYIFLQDFMLALSETKILLLFLLATLLCWYIKYLWHMRKIYWHSFKISGPLSLPFIGAGYMVLGSGSQIFEKILEIQDRYPGLCKVWLGNHLIILISEPKYIKTVLNSPNAIDKHELYFIFTDIIGDGLITSKAKIWRQHRKIIAPSFNQKVLDSFVDVFVEQTKIFNEKLNKLVGEKDVGWYPLVSQCTLDMVCETAVGVNMNIQNGNEGIGEYLEKILEMANQRIFRVHLHPSFIWNLTKAKREFVENIEQFKKITNAVIRKKMNEHEKEKTVKNDYGETKNGSSLKKRAFLDLLLDFSDFTETELRDEITTFLFAGTETSAKTICALFTVLGMFPEIQQKVYEEVIDVIGRDRDVEASDLPKMYYTERVIKETLRLFPVAPVFGRTVTGDIKIGNAILAAGSSVVINPVHIHRNPKFWTDPLKFDPDRFLSEEVAKRHPCTYIPFSHGPRNCIGGRYAMMNMKTVVAAVIRQFRIHSYYKSIEEIKLEVQFFLRFQDGYKIWFEHR